MQLEAEWKKCWRWFSVQGAMIVIAAPQIYGQVTAMREFISPATFNHIMSVLGVLIILGRITAQASKNEPTP